MARPYVLHVFKNYNGTWKVEDNDDSVVGDYFDTAEEAYKWAKARYPKNEVYPYRDPNLYRPRY